MIILASHGKMAIGIKDTVEMIAGKQSDLYAYSAYSDGIDSVKNIIREQILNSVEDKIFVLTDILGGSVNREITELLQEFPQIILITGMNLPLILTLITMGKGVDVAVLIAEGQSGLLSVNQSLSSLELEEDEL